MGRLQIRVSEIQQDSIQIILNFALFEMEPLQIIKVI